MKTITSFLISSIFFTLVLSAQQNITIYDAQYVDPNGGTDDSPFNFQNVTLTGVVTASAESNNLGAVFIQQEGLTEWAGIHLKSGPGLDTLKVGDVVTVTGFIAEEFGATLINFVTAHEVIGTSNISPVTVAPEVFTSYSLAETEKYESMLIELQNPVGNLYVVNDNPDGPNNNFGDWRVGSDSLNADTGCRITTGRITSNVFSSLNVSYINDSVWVNNSGTLNVPAIVIKNGDQFEAIRGIMYYGFNNMRLLPRNNDDFSIMTVGVSDRLLPVSHISLFPNPVHFESVLELTLENEMTLDISMYDLNGKLVQKFANHESWPEGKQRRTLHFHDSIPTGTYFLVISNGKEFQRIKMIKNE